jgi:hypothetical protein
MANAGSPVLPHHTRTASYSYRPGGTDRPPRLNNNCSFKDDQSTPDGFDRIHEPSNTVISHSGTDRPLWFQEQKLDKK